MTNLVKSGKSGKMWGGNGKNLVKTGEKSGTGPQFSRDRDRESQSLAGPVPGLGLGERVWRDRYRYRDWETESGGTGTGTGTGGQSLAVPVPIPGFWVQRDGNSRPAGSTRRSLL